MSSVLSSDFGSVGLGFKLTWSCSSISSVSLVRMAASTKTGSDWTFFDFRLGLIPTTTSSSTFLVADSDCFGFKSIWYCSSGSSGLGSEGCWGLISNDSSGSSIVTGLTSLLEGFLTVALVWISSIFLMSSVLGSISSTFSVFSSGIVTFKEIGSGPSSLNLDFRFGFGRIVTSSSTFSVSGSVNLGFKVTCSSLISLIVSLGTVKVSSTLTSSVLDSEVFIGLTSNDSSDSSTWWGLTAFFDGRLKLVSGTSSIFSWTVSVLASSGFDSKLITRCSSVFSVSFSAIFSFLEVFFTVFFGLTSATFPGFIGVVSSSILFGFTSWVSRLGFSVKSSLISSGWGFSIIESGALTISGPFVEGVSAMIEVVSSAATFDFDFFLIFITSVFTSTTSGAEGLRGKSKLFSSRVSLFSGICVEGWIGVSTSTLGGKGLDFGASMTSWSASSGLGLTSATDGLRSKVLSILSTLGLIGTSFGSVMLLSWTVSKVKSSMLLAALRRISGDEGILWYSSSLGSISSSLTPTCFCSVIPKVGVWGLESGVTWVGVVDSANRITSCVTGRQLPVVWATVGVWLSVGRSSNGVSLTKGWTSLTWMVCFSSARDLAKSESTKTDSSRGLSLINVKTLEVSTVWRSSIIGRVLLICLVRGTKSSIGPSLTAISTLETLVSTLTGNTRTAFFSGCCKPATKSSVLKSSTTWPTLTARCSNIFIVGLSGIISSIFCWRVA